MCASPEELVKDVSYTYRLIAVEKACREVTKFSSKFLVYYKIVRMLPLMFQNWPSVDVLDMPLVLRLCSGNNSFDIRKSDIVTIPHPTVAVRSPPFVKAYIVTLLREIPAVQLATQ